ncbi:MAG: hypothetical protein HY456_00195 [Parcubacteria group bacterium]|nr:hypothetical protein [Parcubacteria group bacterium]
MRTIVEYKTNRAHYKNAPCIVWCFDDRFDGLWNAFVEYLKHNGFAHKDPVKVAGGAKDLASPDGEYKRRRILWDIEASIKLHNPPWIGLMAHADCGAYGKKFENQNEERAFYASELEKAVTTVKNFLRSRNIELPVIKYFADFEGLHETD